MPSDLAQCKDRGLVGTIHFLNLHCNDEIREQRLRARPAWRGASDEFIDEHRRFAQWQLDNAATSYDPPMPTVDTSHRTVEEAGQEIARWVLSIIEDRPKREPSPLY